MIKCAECGANLIAQTRRWCGKEYVEYTCNSCHRYGKKYCTPHTVRESQLDELVSDEIKSFKEQVMAESKKYDSLMKQWAKKKPLHEREIKQCSEKIASLKQQVEDLIMDRVHDREHVQIYNDMIAKREEEIAEFEKRINELKEYDKTCKQ